MLIIQSPIITSYTSDIWFCVQVYWFSLTIIYFFIRPHSAACWHWIWGNDAPFQTFSCDSLFKRSHYSIISYLVPSTKVTSMLICVGNNESNNLFTSCRVCQYPPVALCPLWETLTYNISCMFLIYVFTIHRAVDKHLEEDPHFQSQFTTIPWQPLRIPHFADLSICCIYLSMLQYISGYILFDIFCITVKFI